MGRKADEINDLGGGLREEISYRRRESERGDRARTRRIKNAQGRTIEVWHEVVDVHGNVLHQHQIPVRKKGH